MVEENLFRLCLKCLCKPTEITVRVQHFFSFRPAWEANYREGLLIVQVKTVGHRTSLRLTLTLKHARVILIKFLVEHSDLQHADFDF